MRFCWLALGASLLAAPAFGNASPVRRHVQQRRPERMYVSTHPAMGTTWTLYLYEAEDARAAEIAGEVFDEVDRINDLLSNYLETSELSRINREAGERAVTTDPETFAFLEQAQHWSRVSGGAFDMTVGRLMKAYGFFRHEGRVPSANETEDLRPVTGWQKMQLDAAAHTVRFVQPGVELDPGGIGKGFAVDEAVRILREQKVQAAMISAGSSTLYALGAPPGKRGWRVVVPGPLPSKDALSVVTLRDTSLSSADCSEKNFTLGGHLYCHIMDPQTLRPVEGRIQVSVIDPSATASDALSNVVFVEAPAQSAQTLRRFAPTAAMLVVSSYPEPEGMLAATAAAVCTSYRWPGRIDRSHCNVRTAP